MTKKKGGLTRKDVEHVATLARLPLTEKELTKFQKQLAKILDYIQQLQELNTEKVEPTSQVTGLENVLRPDKVDKSGCLSSQEALANTPSKQGDYFKVKGVFEEE